MDEGLSTTDGLKPRPNKARAAWKLALVIGIVAAVLTLLIGFVSAKTVNGLVNHLTLGLLVALIVIVNLVSVLLCLIFFAAYRWIKRDLDPDAED